jgi:hypothetical protein
VKIAIRLFALAVALVAALAAAEITLRMLDRRMPSSGAPEPGALAQHYVEHLPSAEGVRREWFAQSPDPLPRPPLPPELAAVADRVRSDGTGPDIFKRWNARFIQERVCSGDPFFQKFPGFAFAFVPDEPTPHPPYRYLSSVATPYGLITNRFGFRGRDLSPDKPAGAIRIAVIGASTAVGAHSQPFSYPEYLEPWLTLVAQRHAPGVRVEIINAGREGISTADIAAIVKHELMPLEPDIIVYHHGTNTFSFREMMDENARTAVVPSNLSPRSHVPFVDRLRLMRRLDVAVRRYGFGAGSEPRKPPYRLQWPEGVDERDPNPDAPRLPLQLPQTVRDLDAIAQTAAAGGARLVLTSFIWMADDGLVVDPVDGAQFFRALNLPHWPARYADIRRMADFYNRTIQAYARSRHLDFLDVAAGFPRDVALFGDPVHTTADGDRLRAWVLFQGLAPILREELAAGRLPRPDRSPMHVAPVPLDRDPLVCTDFNSYARADELAPLTALHASDDHASVSDDRVRRVVTPPTRYGYAAEVPLARSARVARPGAVFMRFRVVSGNVTIGVLNANRSAFLLYNTYAAATGATEMRLPLPSMSDAGFLMITNAASRDGERSVVDVEETGVLLRR